MTLPMTLPMTLKTRSACSLFILTLLSLGVTAHGRADDDALTQDDPKSGQLFPWATLGDVVKLEPPYDSDVPQWHIRGFRMISGEQATAELKDPSVNFRLSVSIRAGSDSTYLDITRRAEVGTQRQGLSQPKLSDGYWRSGLDAVAGERERQEWVAYFGTHYVSSILLGAYQEHRQSFVIKNRERALAALPELRALESVIAVRPEDISEQRLATQDEATKTLLKKTEQLVDDGILSFSGSRYSSCGGLDTQRIEEMGKTAREYFRKFLESEKNACMIAVNVTPLPPVSELMK